MTCSQRSETIPRHPILPETLFILSTAGLPLLLQTPSYMVFPRWRWNLATALVYYHAAFLYVSIKAVARFQRWTREYGTFNEEHSARNLVPDVHVNRIAVSFLRHLSTMTRLNLC